jgi:hypothetical protein
VYNSGSCSPKYVAFYNKLNPRAKIYGKLMVTGINHVDFHYGIHRKEKVFNKIKQLLEKI